EAFVFATDGSALIRRRRGMPPLLVRPLRVAHAAHHSALAHHPGTAVPHVAAHHPAVLHHSTTSHAAAHHPLRAVVMPHRAPATHHSAWITLRGGGQDEGSGA